MSEDSNNLDPQNDEDNDESVHKPSDAFPKSSSDEDSSDKSSDEANTSSDEIVEPRKKYPHICQICNEKFLFNVRLKNHMETLHGIEVYLN